MTIEHAVLRKELMQTIIDNTDARVESVVTTTDVYGVLSITVVIDDEHPQITDVIEEALAGYGIVPTRWMTNPWKESWLKIMIWANQT